MSVNPMAYPTLLAGILAAILPCGLTVRSPSETSVARPTGSASAITDLDGDMIPASLAAVVENSLWGVDGKEPKPCQKEWMKEATLFSVEHKDKTTTCSERCAAAMEHFSGKLCWAESPLQGMPQRFIPAEIDIVAFTHILPFTNFVGLPDGAEQGRPPFAVFVLPLVDHNGAFALEDSLCKRLECWRSRGYTVVARRVQNATQAREFIETFADDSIGHLVLAGHGTPTTLAWGPGNDDGLTSVAGAKRESTRRLLEAVVPKLQQQAKVLLDSCSSAGGVGFWGSLRGRVNLFGYVASRLAGAIVKASSRDFNQLAMTISDKPETMCELTGINVLRHDGRVEDAMQTKYTPKLCRDLPLGTAFPQECLGRCRRSCENSSPSCMSGTCVLEPSTRAGIKKVWNTRCNIGHRKLCVATNATVKVEESIDGIQAVPEDESPEGYAAVTKHFPFRIGDQVVVRRNLALVRQLCIQSDAMWNEEKEKYLGQPGVVSGKDWLGTGVRVTFEDGHWWSFAPAALFTKISQVGLERERFVEGSDRPFGEGSEEDFEHEGNTEMDWDKVFTQMAEVRKKMEVAGEGQDTSNSEAREARDKPESEE